MVVRTSLAILTLTLAVAGVRAEPQSVLDALEAEITAMAGRVTPAVVRVEAEKNRTLSVSPGDGSVRIRPVFTESSVGSGFVVGREKLILASHSVVAGATSVWVTFGDGPRVAARLVDSSPYFRVAVLEAVVPASIEPLELSAREPRRGALAVLFGNPHDTGSSLMLGLVGDPARAHLGFDRFLVMSVPLMPGESGAPFIGSDGRVMGLGSASLSGREVGASFAAGPSGIVRTTSSTAGSRFACCVPARDLRYVLDEIREHGRLRQAWLGVTLKDEDPRIKGVVERSPAQGAGLAAGDLILAFQGRPIPDRYALLGCLARTKPGTVVAIRVERGEATTEIEVALAERPAPDERDLVLEETGVRVMRVPDGCDPRLIGEGDLIVSVDGEPATDIERVRDALARLGGGAPYELVVFRNETRMTMSNR